MNLTGPLGKQYCIVFKLLSLFSLSFAIIALIAITYALATSPKPYGIVFPLIVFIPIWLVTYVQNRVLYNICLQ
jgi:uncharacterized membrane protein